MDNKEITALFTYVYFFPLKLMLGLYTPQTVDTVTKSASSKILRISTRISLGLWNGPCRRSRRSKRLRGAESLSSSLGGPFLSCEHPRYDGLLPYNYRIPADEFPQGWGGPKTFNGEFIEGSFHSHQVPLPNAKTDSKSLQALQDWLASYKPHELFRMTSEPDDGGERGCPVDEVLSIVPNENAKKLGQRKEAYAAYHALTVPEWIDRGVQKGSQESCMKLVGSFLKEIVKECVNTLPLLAHRTQFFPLV